MEVLNKFHKVLRIKEVTLMTGFFVIGAFFSIKEITFDSIIQLLLIYLTSFFLIISIYAFNAYGGKTIDKFNQRLAHLKLINSRYYLIIAIITLCISLLTAFLINIYISIISFVLFIIWFFYSTDKIALKSKPFVGTILHFLAQILHFNMCYLVFAPIDFNSIAISLYFSFAFAAGHLNHEIIDYQADMSSGIKTTTIIHGVSFSRNAIIILCLLNIFLTIILYLYLIIDLTTFTIMIATVFSHLMVYIVFLKNILNKAKTVRSYYRTFYFIGFACLMAYKIYKMSAI